MDSSKARRLLMDSDTDKKSSTVMSVSDEPKKRVHRLRTELNHELMPQCLVILHNTVQVTIYRVK